MNKYQEFNVGDLITTYFKGFFILTKIEIRDNNNNPLFYFTQKYDSNGKEKTSKEKMCDEGYCKLASTYIVKEIKVLENKITQLKSIK